MTLVRLTQLLSIGDTSNIKIDVATVPLFIVTVVLEMINASRLTA